MKTKILLLYIFLALSYSSISQSVDLKHTAISTFTLPDNQNGPVSFGGFINYSFTYSCWTTVMNLYSKLADGYSVNGTKYRYNGKIYDLDVIMQHDNRGLEGMSEIRINSVSFKFQFSNLKYCNSTKWQNVQYGTAASDDAKQSYIDLTFDCEKLKLDMDYIGSVALNFTGCSSVKFENTQIIEERIKNYIKQMDNKGAYDNVIKQADDFFNNQDFLKATDLYTNALKIFPNENYPKTQIQKCIDNIAAEKARKVKEDQAAQTTQNTSNSGTNNGSSNSNGSGTTNSNSNNSGDNSGSSNTNSSNNSSSSSSSNSSEEWNTSEEEQESTATRTVPIDEGWTQADTDQFLAKNQADREAQESKIRQESAAFAKSVDYSIQSYYTMQAIDETRSIVQQNMTLSGNYSSVEELEREYNEKFRALDQSIDDMHQQEQDQNLNTMNYYSTQTTGNTQAIGTIASGALYMINEAQNKKEEEWAKEQLRQQKEQAAIDIENKRIAQRQAMRNDLFNMFPEGGIPLSQHKVKANEIYFFFYSFDESTINQTSPTIQLSNVFPIAKYSDGTWPFRSNLNNELSKLGLTGKMTLVGFYTTQQMAQDMHDSYTRLSNSSGMSITEVFYNGKPSTKTSSEINNTSNNNSQQGSTPLKKEDFWGESVKTTTVNKTPAGTSEKPVTAKPAEVDFWGVPVKTESTNKTKTTTTKPTTTKPLTPAKQEEDFWGTPVKKN